MKMRLNLTRIVALVMVVGCLAAAPMALGQAGEQQKLDINLVDADLRTAVNFIVEKSGLSIVFESNETEFKKVNLRLVDVTPETAIEYICKSAGVFFRRNEDGVYVISRNKPEEKKPVEVVVPDIKLKKKLYKMKVRHASVEDLFMQITRGVAPDPDGAMMTMARNSRSLSNIQLNRINFGRDAVDYGVTPRNTAITQPGTSINTGSNTIVLPGEAAPQGGFGGGLGQGGGGAGGGLGQGGGQQGAGQGGGQLSSGGLIDGAIDFITFDPNDNSILIRATEAQWRELQGYVDMFDIAPKQVTVKVQFVTTSSSNARTIGYDWLYSRGTQTVGNVPGTFARNQDPIFLSWQSGNIQTRLRTFLQDGYGTTVSSPVVRTMNNQTAFVSQGISLTVWIPQTIITQNLAQTVYQPFPFQAQNQLTVRPRINDDGTVTMILQPFIQQLGQIRRGPDGSAIPDISFQTINVAARVRSGETVVLAGFTSKSDQTTSTKFPVLGDLPVIGQFFRSSSKDTNNSELLIFVTPTVEDSEASGGFGG